MQVLLQVLVILTKYTLEGFLIYLFIFFRKLVCKILCCDKGVCLEHFQWGGGGGMLGHCLQTGWPPVTKKKELNSTVYYVNPIDFFT